MMACADSHYEPLLLAGARYNTMSTSLFTARAGLLFITFDLPSSTSFTGYRSYIADSCPCFLVWEIIIH